MKVILKSRISVEQEFTRKDHVIKDMAGKVIFTGKQGTNKNAPPSINAAKRESRRLQGERLGCGLLRVAA